MSSWKDLQLAGWEFVEFNQKKRLNRYRTPLRKGKRKIINEKKDLPQEFVKYAKILFPGSQDGAMRIQEEARQQQEPEEDADGGEAGEAEVLQEQAEERQEQDGGQEREVGGGEAGEEAEEEQQELEQHEEQEELEQGEELDHEATLKAAGREVEKMIKAINAEDINIKRSVEDLAFALANKEHPFSELPSCKSNFFCDAIEFGLRYNVDLLYTTAVHMFTLESLACMDPVKVIQLATAYTNIVCGHNPKKNNGLKKAVSLLAQSCGVSNDCLDVMATLGFTESSR